MHWTQQEAIDLCRKIEAICPKYGCHVALTGGLLYKDGSRKDCDLLFYRIRQVERIDKDGLFAELDEKCDIIQESGFGWCHKALYSRGSDTDQNRWGKMDLFFPEEIGGGYQNQTIIKL